MTASPRHKPAPPFSIRLGEDLHARLERAADGMPLSEFIRWIIEQHLTGLALPRPKTRRKRSTTDFEKAVAQLLGQLGQSRVPNNLNQIARAINTGTLELTSDIESELLEAARLVIEIRAILIEALRLSESA